MYKEFSLGVENEIMRIPKYEGYALDDERLVDSLTKSAHFVLVKTDYQASEIESVFINEMIRLNGILKKIISYRGLVFIRTFWTSFEEVMGTKLNFSTSYHPDTNG
jgi:hypothetical protein